MEVTLMKGVKRYWWPYSNPQRAVLEKKKKNVTLKKAKQFGGWGKVIKLG